MFRLALIAACASATVAVGPSGHQQWTSTRVEGQYVTVQANRNAVSCSTEAGITRARLWALGNEGYTLAADFVLSSTGAVIALASSDTADTNMVYAVTDDGVLHVFRAEPASAWVQAVATVPMDGIPSRLVVGRDAFWVTVGSTTVLRFELRADGAPAQNHGKGYSMLKWDLSAGSIAAFDATGRAGVVQTASGELLYLTVLGSLTEDGEGVVYRLEQHPLGPLAALVPRSPSVIWAASEHTGRVFLFVQDETGVLSLVEIVATYDQRRRSPPSWANATVPDFIPELRARRQYSVPARAELAAVVYRHNHVLSAWRHEVTSGNATAWSILDAPLSPRGWWDPSHPLAKLFPAGRLPLPDAAATATVAPLKSGEVLYATVGHTLYQYQLLATAAPEGSGAWAYSHSKVRVFYIVPCAIAVLFFAVSAMMWWRRRTQDQVHRQVRSAIEAERMRDQRRAPSVAVLPLLPECVYGEDFVDEPPHHFLCPLALHVMNDPVTCVDGHHTFERAYLTRALRVRAECPLSREPMTLDDVRDNPALEEEILEWVAAHVARHPGANVCLPAEKTIALAKYREAQAERAREPAEPKGVSSASPDLMPKDAVVVDNADSDSAHGGVGEQGAEPPLCAVTLAEAIDVESVSTPSSSPRLPHAVLDEIC
eukprot:TRINITY_DN1982_c2_g1_i2.p1 TRINITY_DN1982_c2_g1~~TRINITY_DN1982_c2_g1_i2.p1  ORF type:complete len:656 (+),score=86.13 TRINITY_DN1982_c2_g1_i2:49-2016(+)